MEARELDRLVAALDKYPVYYFGDVESGEQVAEFLNGQEARMVNGRILDLTSVDVKKFFRHTPILH